jgi:hypothetical protein
MNIHSRLFTPSDTNFIESLIPRASEFDLSAWRQRDEIDKTNLVSLTDCNSQVSLYTSLGCLKKDFPRHRRPELGIQTFG